MHPNLHYVFFLQNMFKLEAAYFGEHTITGISVQNAFSRKYEDAEIVSERLNVGRIDEVVVAWKAGQFERNGQEYIPRLKKGNYFNQYGKPINKICLDRFLQSVQGIYAQNVGKDFRTI